MLKLVSGIALVVLLDIAFIWMMAGEPETPEFAHVIGPTAAFPVIHESQPAAPVAIDDSIEPVEEQTYSVADIRPRSQARNDSRPAVRDAQPDSTTIAATAPVKLFEDTVIWIGRTEVPVKIDTREEAPVVAESKQSGLVQASIAEPRSEKRKRSFQSKAFSVIKKPYDWIKAAADKLH